MHKKSISLLNQAVADEITALHSTCIFISITTIRVLTLWQGCLKGLQSTR